MAKEFEHKKTCIKCNYATLTSLSCLCPPLKVSIYAERYCTKLTENAVVSVFMVVVLLVMRPICINSTHNMKAPKKMHA